MAGFSLDNMKVMGDLLKFLDKFDIKGNSIEDSFKNIDKSIGNMARNVKAMDGSFGGSTGAVGNGAAGSTMSQPSIGGTTGGAFTGGAAAQSAREAFGGGAHETVQAIGIKQTPAQAGNAFIDQVFNGIVGKLIKPGVLLGYNALPSVEQSFQMNTNKQRMSFLGMGGMGGSLANKDAAYTQLLLQTAKSGTGLGLEDILGGFEGSRQLGSNISGIGRSLSTASNITPGVGLTGAAQALTALNAPRNVNFLRMIGVQVRDAATGNMREIDQIIDDLWRTISRQARGKAAITVNDLRLSLQPGNALASMLDQYFGNDQYLRTIVEDGLYAKAQGATLGDKVSLQRIGATTQAIASKASREAASTAMVEKASGPMMFGFEKANQLSTALSNFMGSAFFGKSPLSIFGRGLAGSKGFLDTFAGMGNESGSMMLTQLGSLLGKIPFLAGGGDVGGRNAYVVGEKGPELFIPESDGTIVPHHELDLNRLQFAGFRHAGGAISKYGPDGSHAHTNVWNGTLHKHGNNNNPKMPQEKLIEILKAAGFQSELKTKGGVTLNPIQDALQIIGAESGGNPLAENFNEKTGDLSYGLFQINMQPAFGPGRRKNYGINYDWQLYDPLTNAKAAYKISHGGLIWKDAWTNSANKTGLGGPFGNPHGGNKGLLGGIESAWNQFTNSTGVVGDVLAAGAAGAANTVSSVTDFLGNASSFMGNAQSFVNEILKLFKNFMPGLGAKETGGAVVAQGVNHGGSRGTNVNYGGVTIKLVGNGNWDERKLAQEIKKTLEYDELMRRAANH